MSDLQRAVMAYLHRLQAMTNDVVNSSHFWLFELWREFGRGEVDAEVDRQLRIDQLDLLPEWNAFVQKWEVSNNDQQGNTIDAWQFDTEDEGLAFIDRWVEYQILHRDAQRRKEGV